MRAGFHCFSAAAVAFGLLIHYTVYICTENGNVESMMPAKEVALSQSLRVYLYVAGSHEQNIIVLALYFILSSLPVPLFKVTLYFGP